MTAQPLTDVALELGEGVRSVDGRLVLVDILAGRLLEHSGEAGAPLTTVAELDVPLGAVAPVAGQPGHWIAAAGGGVALLDPAGQVTWLDQPEQRGATRMNDGVADPTGRFWAGSMAYDASSPLGSLYRVDSDGAVHQVWDGLTIANGPAFSLDGAVMYLADTAKRVVFRFTVSERGELAGPEEFWRPAPDEGAPDGMTVDDDGHLWVAMWGGSAVLRIAPDGDTVARVSVPARQPTSACLVDGRLVVTSATTGLADPGPADGRLYAVQLGDLGITADARPAREYRGG
jgi:sugar lactone lactonase YvrE